MLATEKFHRIFFPSTVSNFAAAVKEEGKEEEGGVG